MNLPSAPQNYQQERLGITSVAMALTSLGVIWRETPMADVGIDGQIEHVSPDGKATGRLLAAQVKSGPSYFHDHDTHWHFYPDDKHRFYWERFPIPVILFLHDPDHQATYWCDARQCLRSPASSSQAYIAIPKEQRLDNTTREQLFAVTGVGSDAFLEVSDILNHMMLARCPNASFPVSYFELFVHGLTNICRTLYFSMDVAMNVAEFNLERTNAITGVGVGAPEHDFLFSYLRFIVSQHLADVDFADCLIDWFDREMQPSYFAPLTSRGRQLVSLIGEHEKRLREAGAIHGHIAGIHVAQEALIGVQMTPGTAARFPLVTDFIEAFGRTSS
jgi:hypothetical protein